MTQDMVKMMSQDKMIGKREILSSSPSPWFSRFLRAMLLLLMMTLGVGEMLGQDTDYSGKYYIASDAIVSNKSTYDENTPANNYYLCPTDGWCYYKPDNNYSDDGNAYPNPFLTTFKWRDGVNDNKVIWIIEKCPNSNYSNYYYIKQHIEGNRYKYLMLNGKISGTSNNGKNRMRVHLEELDEDTDNPTTNALFSITLASSSAAAGNVTSLANEKSVIITPKNTENEDSKCKYLVVNGGNANYLTGQSAKSDGPGTSNEKYKWTGGIIGLYYDENGKQDANAPFYLENKPTISFSDQNKVRITYFDYADNEVEIRYTINGDAPTASSTLYEGEFDPPAGTNMIKAIAIKDEKESDVTTFSPPVFLGSTHQYIIQSKNCKFYNMIPNVSVDDDTKYVSALNVPCSTMAWHFEYAEEGYYYIVDANGWYMYYTTTDNTNKYIYLKSSKDDSDGYKFQIASHANGGYNIIPKGQTKAIYKNNFGNNDAGLKPVMFDGTITNDVARWDLIPYSTTNLPMWEDQPFTVSTDEETYYYNIVSVSQPAKPLILNNSGLIKSEIVPTSDYDERKAMWVIKKVGQDTGGLLDYYTLQNAYTGDLLYYNGSGREIAKNASPGVLQNGMPTTEGADATWAHFVIVQTVSGYNIIPRVLVDNTKAITRNSTHEAFNCINRASGNDWTGTYYDIDNGSRWTFTKVDNVKCMEPVFTEEANGDITITTVTNAAKIRYSVDGADPTESSAEYTTKENTSVQKVIKAIAIIGDDINTASSVVTLLNKPDITLGGTAPYIYNASPWEPGVTEVSIGEASNKTSTTSGYSIAYSENHTDAGEVTVTVTDNVEDDLFIKNASTTFTIQRKDVTITASDASKTYNGSALTKDEFTATDLETGDTHTFTVAMTAESTITDAGTQPNVIATVDGVSVTTGTEMVVGNYLVTTANGTLTVNPASVTLTANSRNTDVYDGTEKTVTGFTCKLGEQTVEGLTFEGVSASGSGTNAGDYDVTFTGVTVNETKDNTGNYVVIGTTVGTLTIKPASVTLTANSRNTDVYDGTEKTVTGFICKMGEQTVEGLSFGESVTASGSGTDAGDYVVTVTGVTVNETKDNTGNYVVTGTTNGTLTINPLTVEITWVGTDFAYTYNGNSQAPTATASGTINDEEVIVTIIPSAQDGSSLSEEKAVNVGSYIAKATALSNSNYTLYKNNSSTGDFIDNIEQAFTIVPAELTAVTIDQTELIYNGAEQTVTVTSIKAGELNVTDDDYVVSGNAQTNANAVGESYTVIVKAKENTTEPLYVNNFTGEVTTTFTIQPKPIGVGDDDVRPLASGFSVSVGEGNTIILKDGETPLTENIDYTVGVAESSASGRYSVRKITGQGNYGSFTNVRNAIVHFMNDGNGGSVYSATFVAEPAGAVAADDTKGHALPDGITAYIITAIDGNTANAVPLEYIPEGVPVLLLSNANVSGFLVVDATVTEEQKITDAQKTANMLEEVKTGMAGFVSDTEDSNFQKANFNVKTIYLLYMNEFVYNMEGYLAKGKVYLNPNHPNDPSTASTSPSPTRLMIMWGEDNGIDTSHLSPLCSQLPDMWYSIDGRRLSGKPTRKGLYLKNGQKIVVR